MKIFKSISKFTRHKLYISKISNNKINIELIIKK